MNSKKIIKFVLIFMFGMVVFLMDGIDIYAKQTFPDYAIVYSGYYCDYEIYTTNDDSAKSTYNGHHIYLTYSNGSVKWVNPSTGKLMSSGDRWDTDGVLKQSIKYDSSALTKVLVSNGKLAFCPTLYFKEIDNKYNLRISTDPTSVRHGGISGEPHIEGVSTEVTELGTQPCSYTPKFCTPGSFIGDSLGGSLLIHRYSDGTISYNFDNDELTNNYKINMSGIDASYFKDGCPKEVYVDCGGVASEGTGYCNVVKESSCQYQSGESNGASGHNSGEDKKITPGKSGSDENGNNGGTENCEEILGSRVMDDIRDILKWVRIAAPILVVVLGSVDFAKAVLSDDPKALSKAASSFAKRMIAAVALFFAPLIIMYLLEFANNVISESSCPIRGL